jgi:hypothetical protein
VGHNIVEKATFGSTILSKNPHWKVEFDFAMWVFRLCKS